MTSNNTGKTSASGTMGVLMCTVSSLAFIYGAFTKQDSLLIQCTVFGGLGAGLLGYRKSREDEKNPINSDAVDSKESTNSDSASTK